MVLPVAILFLLTASVSQKAPPVSKFNIVVVEGQNAINALTAKSTRRLTVRVERQYGVPVASVPVTFVVPQRHGAFAGGQTTVTLKTDEKGYAVVRDFHPRGLPGEFRMQVTASGEGYIARAEIAQTNARAEKSGFFRRSAGRMLGAFRRLKFW